jgi:hypothetical protein
MSCPCDERDVLREVMARPWLLSGQEWAFVVGLQERSDVPFSAIEKVRLSAIYRKVMSETHDD